jgi:hypothetical protein
LNFLNHKYSKISQIHRRIVIQSLKSAFNFNSIGQEQVQISEKKVVNKNPSKLFMYINPGSPQLHPLHIIGGEGRKRNGGKGSRRRNRGGAGPLERRKRKID